MHYNTVQEVHTQTALLWAGGSPVRRTIPPNADLPYPPCPTPPPLAGLLHKMASARELFHHVSCNPVRYRCLSCNDSGLVARGLLDGGLLIITAVRVVDVGRRDVARTPSMHVFHHSLVTLACFRDNRPLDVVSTPENLWPTTSSRSGCPGYPTTLGEAVHPVLLPPASPRLLLIG